MPLQAQLPLFEKRCIFNHFEISDDMTWAHKLRTKKDKKRNEDIQWILDLINKYSK